MDEIKVGDKFLIRKREYIVCKIQGLYYLVNLNTGGLWTDGLDYDRLLLQSTIYNFTRI